MQGLEERREFIAFVVRDVSSKVVDRVLAKVFETQQDIDLDGPVLVTVFLHDLLNDPSQILLDFGFLCFRFDSHTQLTHRQI